MTVTDSALSAAYAECRRLARRHYENFPVASYLVPREKRDALAAIYSFARYADEVADELGIDGRVQALAEWRRKLGQCHRGHADHPVFIALRDTITRFHLPEEHFQNLLAAFEQDVRVNRREDFSSLLAYCTCSADPVGRLVLELFGHRDPELFTLSDSICTALQLTNFWQDIALDLGRGRVYLPLEDLRRFDYSLDDLRAGRADERWQRLLALEIARTREFFDRGKALPERVVKELRTQLRLTWLGGMTILTKIERAHYDVFRHRPRLSRLDFLRLYLKARGVPLVQHAGQQTSAPAVASRS